MKFKNTPKNGVKISICILIIILLLLAIVKIFPNEGVQIKYGFKINNGVEQLWKKILYIIIVILSVLEFIIVRTMCRCNQCGKYISMNINTKYCPYCSKKLDE